MEGATPPGGVGSNVGEALPAAACRKSEVWQLSEKVERVDEAKIERLFVQFTGRNSCNCGNSLRQRLNGIK